MDGYPSPSQNYEVIRFSDSFEALDMKKRTVIYGTRARYGFEFVEFNSAKPAAGVDIKKTGGGVVIYRQAIMDQELAKTFLNAPDAPTPDPRKLYFRAWMSNGDPNGGGRWQYGWFWNVHPDYPDDEPQQW